MYLSSIQGKTKTATRFTREVPRSNVKDISDDEVTTPPPRSVIPDSSRDSHRENVRGVSFANEAVRRG